MQLAEMTEHVLRTDLNCAAAARMKPGRASCNDLQRLARALRRLQEQPARRLLHRIHPLRPQAADQWRPPPLPLASRVRTPAAEVNWFSGRSPRKICPLRTERHPGNPRSAFFCAASSAREEGSVACPRDLRLWVAQRQLAVSAAEQLRLISAMNDHVTASSMPRDRKRARSLSPAHLEGVRTGLRGASPRSNGVAGIRSTPMMRTTSSTMSALPWMSRRHDGTAIRRFRSCTTTENPSRPSTCTISAGSRSRPASRATSVRGKSMLRSGTFTLPATVISEASPPHISSTICVASSSPGSIKAGSTPRSNR